MASNENSKSVKSSLLGEVISTSMDKTITVRVTRRIKHPAGKYITRYSKIAAHDPENSAKVGDSVRIEQCRPISKRKSWRLVNDTAK